MTLFVAVYAGFLYFIDWYHWLWAAPLFALIFATLVHPDRPHDDMGHEPVGMFG